MPVYHLNPKGKSMFTGKNQSLVENLFINFSNSFQEYFFYKYYTFLKNDWFFECSSNCLEIQEAFPGQPKIYPIIDFPFLALFLCIAMCTFDFLLHFSYLIINLFLFFLFSLISRIYTNLSKIIAINSIILFSIPI